MTDSTIDNKPGEGGFDVGSSAEELFGEIEDEFLESGVDREAGDDDAAVSDADPGDATADDRKDVEDQTAASVFGQLKADLEDDDSVDLLEDESPEDIIASADEPEPDPEPIDEDLLADEEELTDLLLTGRTKEEEFLWIDPDDESGEAADDRDTESLEDEDATEPADTTEAETALESDDAVGDDLEGTEDTSSVEETEDASSTEDVDADHAEETDADHAEPDDVADGETDELEADDSPSVADDDDESAVIEPEEPATDESAHLETGDKPAETDEDEAPVDEPADATEDDDSRGLIRRLLAALNPF